MSEPHTATLLLVDDEPNILSALRRLFRPQGYRILLAEGGQAGLALLASESVDLVISDMRMPVMDGATFLQQVRQHHPDTIRFLLTGYADIQSTIAAINQGEIHRYLTKPWNDQEILLTVREALEKQALTRENQRLAQLTESQNRALKALNSSLEEKVQARTQALHLAMESLQKTFLATVHLCAGMSELRAGQGARHLLGHGRRVAEHARIVAQRLELPETEVQKIMLAGLLHDIGKIGLPDELLHKPFNSMTAEQRAVMIKHAAQGQNLLMPIEKLRDAALLIRHHHEQFDGHGYPDHLSGVAIPMGSRILAVVNDYDALQMGTLTQRPLKAAEALTFLLDNQGKRYDPTVVDHFARYLAEQHHPSVSEVPMPVRHLKPGMALAQDLHHHDGFLLLAKGSTLTVEIIQELLKMEEHEHRHYTLIIRHEEA